MVEKIKCKLTGLNRIKSIYSIFKIPEECRNRFYDFSNCYEFKYLEKKSAKNQKETKVERTNRFLSMEKERPIFLDELPANKNKKDFRHIINFKKEFGWLKKAQKIFHKLVIPCFADTPYLHSTIKGKSYASNGQAHCGGEKYVLTIDFKDFFTQIDIDMVCKTIKRGLDLQTNTAFYYASLLTCPLEKGSTKMVLGQGLPSSPLLAFWVNKSLFDYIDKVCSMNNITLTVYVDDISLSSDKPISQELINNVIGLFRKNGLKIKRSKTHYYKNTAIKKITGVYINRGLPKVAHKKHEEIFILYKEIVKLVQKGVYNIDDFLNMYGLFLKFSGNFIHLCEVEYDGVFSENKKKFTHQKYAQLYSSLIHVLNIGLERSDNCKGFGKSNLKAKSLSDANTLFKKYKDIESRLKSRFPLVS